MKNKKWLENYAKFFRRRLSEHLKPGIGIDCKVYPVYSQGAVLEFSLGENLSNQDEFAEPQKSINEVLKTVTQRLVGGDISNITFSGTNISMEGNRIIIIKGEDSQEEWNGSGAKKDLDRILSVKTGGS
ncbi:MAG: hypothetical protein KAT62_14815 [Desulfuromonadales bacterium]|nr:hypothetical protein [Desulfuromonadales bacterium]